jgi:excisionase family DNA binding protein
MEKSAEPATSVHASSGELPDVLTVEQAAELFQLSGKTLKRLAQAGGFPGRRVGNQWRFSRQTLMDWLAGKDV